VFIFYFLAYAPRPPLWVRHWAQSLPSRRPPAFPPHPHRSMSRPYPPIPPVAVETRHNCPAQRAQSWISWPDNSDSGTSPYRHCAANRLWRGGKRTLSALALPETLERRRNPLIFLFFPQSYFSVILLASILGRGNPL